MRRSIGAIHLAAAILLFGCGGASPLDWEIARNFRYFAFESDVAVQRVARDLARAETGHAPTPQALERRLDDPGFWTASLAAAGGLRERWPLEWRRSGLDTPLDLVAHLRHVERRPPPPGAGELRRLGWASLLAAGRDAKRPTGFTATCWNPATRLHDNCPEGAGTKGADYVRPRGWFVRVFDPQAAEGSRCAWSGANALVVDPAKPPRIAKGLQDAALGSTWSQRGDCREIALFVPSDPNDPKAVAGHATVRRVADDGASDTLALDPRDRLVIGFGDFFTSGEGNPEAPAIFNGQTWSDGNVPARDADPAVAGDADTRAQWTDRWCHRSAYSWQVRTALDAALADPRQSVTILPYGCSGATILDGLLYAYDGVEHDAADDHGIIGSRAEVGLAYQELCNDYPSSQTSIGAPLAEERASAGTPAAAAAFAARQLAFIRRDVARCGRGGLKRQADAVLLDIGVNDVGFRLWVEGLILEKKLWWIDPAGPAFVPCFRAGKPCDAATAAIFLKLARRYALLRQTFDRYLLPEFGVAPANVIVPVYPRALEDEAGKPCDRGNLGLTIATFRSAWGVGAACGSDPLLGIAFQMGGAFAAIRDVDAVKKVEAARVALNDSLKTFAGAGAAAMTLVEAHVAGFAGRGFCATPHGYPLAAGRCLTPADFDATPCAPGDPPSDPESMDLPRTQPVLQGCDASDIAFFHPFPPGDFEPYARRTRLFRTLNDVYLTIDQRAKWQLDSGAFAVGDLVGRTTGGAFHPTAEAHAIVAGAAAPKLCAALGCGP